MIIPVYHTWWECQYRTFPEHWAVKNLWKKIQPFEGRKIYKRLHFTTPDFDLSIRGRGLDKIF